MCDYVLGVDRQFAVVGLELAQEHGKQRRLATAVGTNHTHTLPGMNLEAGVFDQDLAAAAQGYIGEGEHDRRDYRSRPVRATGERSS
jgi:hypothetical protein